MKLPTDYLLASVERVTRQRYTVALRKMMQREGIYDYTDCKKMGISQSSYHRYHAYAVRQHGNTCIHCEGTTCIFAKELDGVRVFVVECVR